VNIPPFAAPVSNSHPPQQGFNFTPMQMRKDRQEVARMQSRPCVRNDVEHLAGEVAKNLGIDWPGQPKNYIAGEGKQ